VEGLPTTTVTRTLVDLAAVLPERGVERALDRADALQLLDMSDLLGVLREGARRPGASRLRLVLGRHRIGTTLTDTDLEELVLALVRAAGLPEPVAQHPILTYSADLCWPEARLVVEADGDRWHRTRSARQHDRRRDVALANAGWTVLRFTDADIVLDPAYVVAAIRTALAQARPT
jgi:very-short-patch-repair endonuclease